MCVCVCVCIDKFTSRNEKNNFCQYSIHVMIILGSGIVSGPKVPGLGQNLGKKLFITRC